MKPCSSCSRYLRTTETVCPFCATPQRAARAPLAQGLCALVASVVLSACSPSPEGEAEGGTSTSPATSDTMDATSVEGSETSMDATSSPTSDGTSVTTDDSDAGGSFYAGPSDAPPVLECDPWAQDCVEGEKCVPHSSTDMDWDANRCVLVLGDGEAGDSCISSGAVAPEDDCDEGHVCWGLEQGDNGLEGSCTAFCAGSPDDPICAPGTGCLRANEDALTLCVPSCDPNEQDCAAGQMCSWFDSGGYLCVPTAEQSALGEACAFANDCSPGQQCALAEALLDCAGAACCTEFCSLENPQCSDPGHECLPLDDGNAPPQNLDEGICVVPQGCPGDSCLDAIVNEQVTRTF